ncbi:MAG: hypothetical protein IPK03_01110 [Bacteroidetes bacterium]|nr:hypothetical protein [Bacteroidota bacterium]
MKLRCQDNTILPVYHNDPRLKFNPANIGSSKKYGLWNLIPLLISMEYELQVVIEILQAIAVAIKNHLITISLSISSISRPSRTTQIARIHLRLGRSSSLV